MCTKIDFFLFSELPDFYDKVSVKASEGLGENQSMPEVAEVPPVTEVVKRKPISGAGNPGVN